MSNADFLEKVLIDTILAEKIQGYRVCVAVSGGCDSITLLSIFSGIAKKYDINISALHVNHQLNPKSDYWENFCRHISKILNVNFIAKKVKVDVEDGLGIEAAARQARYKIFSEQSHRFIFLAHHMDDQIETFFLQLLRGAGARGLSSMPRSRAPWGGSGPKIIRPWLQIKRRLILDYARQNRITWVEDDSNQDETLDRNFLRRQVLPKVYKKYPNCRPIIARSIKNLADSQTLNQELARIDMAAVDDQEPGLNLTQLKQLNYLRITNLMRYLVFNFSGQFPSKAFLDEVIRQIFEAKEDAQINLPFKHIILRRYRGRLFLCDRQRPEGRSFVRLWRGQKKIKLPEGNGSLIFKTNAEQGLKLEKLSTKNLKIKYRSGGEKMYVRNSTNRRSLKKIFQEAGVPPWIRTDIPLIFLGDELIWMPQTGLSKKFVSRRGEPALSFHWTRYNSLRKGLYLTKKGDD